MIEKVKQLPKTENVINILIYTCKNFEFYTLWYKLFELCTKKVMSTDNK